MSDFTPEIVNDELAQLITQLAAEREVRTVLEVGSGDGMGSTQALLAGLRNKLDWKMACLETRGERFAQLFRNVPKTVSCLQASSVPVTKWMRVEQVRKFNSDHLTMLNKYPIAEILKWREGEVEAAKDLPQEGIATIKREFGVEAFDLVVLDGCPFCGEADLDAVYGSRIIVLDDTNDIKNYTAFDRLAMDRTYQFEAGNVDLRNGYAVFRKL
jgi:hypothetical protein